MSPIELLSRLERTVQHNESWRAYVSQRAVEVQEWINRLRRFASLKPGKVTDACNARADSLQSRLDKVTGVSL
jgi:hypothetical protein